MKRAAILNAFAPQYKGGIETFILNLKALFESRGIQTDLHYLSPSPTLPIESFPLRYAEHIIPPFLLECYMLGKAFSKIEDNYDLVISNNFYGVGYLPKRARAFNIYHSAHAAYAAALEEAISISEFRSLKYLYGHIGDRLGGRGKTKIAVSISVRDELQRHYGFREVTVVNHGIDTGFYKKIGDVEGLRQKWAIPAKAFVGLYAGRWEKGKGIDILEGTIRRHQDILWLLIVGNSECPLSAMPNVKIIQDADRTQMRELYCLADFMLFPSYYEGFGLVIAEAMSCGLPVICTEVGIAKELASCPEMKDLIVPLTRGAEMIDNISSKISLLKTEAPLHNHLSTAGSSIIKSSFSLDMWSANMAVALNLMQR